MLLTYFLTLEISSFCSGLGNVTLNGRYSLRDMLWGRKSRISPFACSYLPFKVARGHFAGTCYGDVKWDSPFALMHCTHVAGTVRKVVHTKQIMHKNTGRELYDRRLEQCS